MNSHENDHQHRPLAEKFKHPFADLRQRLKGDVIPLLLLDPWYSPPTYTYSVLYSLHTFRRLRYSHIHIHRHPSLRSKGEPPQLQGQSREVCQSR